MPTKASAPAPQSPPDAQSLRAFCAVAREGNVSRAALKLHLTQPAVSLQIKALQERTGLQLFTRTPAGLVPTRDGAALLPQAEKVLAALGDFAHAAQSLHHTLRGRLRIGTILDPEFTRLGAFLKQLVESAPQIETELSQGMSGQVRQRVARSELDVGFYLDVPPSAQPAAAQQAQNTNFKKKQANVTAKMSYSAIKNKASELPDDFTSIALSRFSYRVLAPAGWAPQVLGKDWRALAALPWIATPEDSAHHRLLAQVFDPLGVSPKRVALVDQEASMLDLVRSGVGLSLARESIALRESQARGLVMADKVMLDCTLSFVFLTSRAHEPVITAARRALDSVWGNS
jgi:DNA-binding transcriptional LysR family regulator